MKVEVNRLGWTGMEKVSVEIEDLPKKALKIDDWFNPTIGELCINDKNELDIVKSVYWKSPTEMFKGSVMYTFHKSNGKISANNVIRVEVNKGKTFIFEGQVFVPREPLDGGYIKQIALNGRVDKYEYEEFE